MRIYAGNILVIDTETGFKVSDITVESIKASGHTGFVVYDKTLDRLVFRVTQTIAGKGALATPDNWLSNLMAQLTMPEDLIDAFHPALEQHTGATREESMELLQTVYELKNGSSKEYDEGLKNYVHPDGNPAYKQLREDTIKFLTSRSISSDINYQYTNTSYVRKEPEDVLSIALPSINQIFDSAITGVVPEVDYLSLAPNIFESYLYTLPGIERAVEAPSLAVARTRLAAIIKSAYDNNLLKPGTINDNIEINQFIQMPIEHLHGIAENDNEPIQDYEIPMYENLRTFMKYFVRDSVLAVEPNLNEEDLNFATEKFYAKGKLPEYVQSYLFKLIGKIVDAHLRFTGLVSWEHNGDEKDDDERYSDSAKEDSEDFTKKFVSARLMKSSLDAEIVAYIAMSAEEFGCDVWAEAVVKLCRFREYRPRHLIVGKGNNRMIDLITAELITVNTVDLTSVIVNEDEYGGSMTPVNAVFGAFHTKEGEYVSYPFSILAIQTGKLPDNDASVTLFASVSLFDIVRAHKMGKPLLYGYIIGDNGLFEKEVGQPPILGEMEPEQAVKAAQSTYISDELKEWAIKNAVTKITGTSWVVTEGYSIEPDDFTSYTNLAETLSQTHKDMRNSIVQGVMADIFRLGAVEKEEFNFLELLNWYTKEIYPIHAAEFEKRLGLNSTITSKNFEATAFFSEPAEPAPETQGPTHRFNKQDGNNLTMRPIVNEATGKTLALVHLSADKKYTFGAVGEVPEGNINNSAGVKYSANLCALIAEALESARIDSSLPNVFNCLTDNSYLNIAKEITGVQDTGEPNLTPPTAPQDYGIIVGKNSQGKYIAIGGFKEMQDGSIHFASIVDLGGAPRGEDKKFLRDLAPAFLQLALTLDSQSGIKGVKHKMCSINTLTDILLASKS